jgi:hypothetical protein
VKQADLYREIFKNWPAQVIMDNSVIELGHPVSTETMMEACEIVPSSMIVLPDVIGDPAKTEGLSSRAAYEWSKAGLHGFMAVPQGETMTGFINCASRLAELPGVRYWGIPRHATAKLGTRYELTRRVYDVRHMSIHMLGFSDDVRDDLLCTKMWPGHQVVMGIDSAVPIRLGAKGLPMTYHKDPGPRGNFWNTELDDDQLHQVTHNLEMVRTWIS